MRVLDAWPSDNTEIFLILWSLQISCYRHNYCFENHIATGRCRRNLIGKGAIIPLYIFNQCEFDAQHVHLICIYMYTNVILFLLQID